HYAPPDLVLVRQLSMRLRHTPDSQVAVPVDERERRVRLDQDLVFLAVLEERLLLEEDVQLDLVDGRLHVALLKQLLEMADRVVADADRPRPAGGEDLLDPAPGRAPPLGD